MNDFNSSEENSNSIAVLNNVNVHPNMYLEYDY